MFHVTHVHDMHQSDGCNKTYLTRALHSLHFTEVLSIHAYSTRIVNHMLKLRVSHRMAMEID